jgi:hypothetical protein
MRQRDLVPGEGPPPYRVDAAVDDELTGGRGLLQMREMQALDTLLAHPDVARVEGEIETRGAGAEDLRLRRLPSCPAQPTGSPSLVG